MYNLFESIIVVDYAYNRKSGVVMRIKYACLHGPLNRQNTRKLNLMQKDKWTNISIKESNQRNKQTDRKMHFIQNLINL